MIVRTLGIALLLVASATFATPPDNRPPDNRPPDRGGDSAQNTSQTQSSQQDQTQLQSVENNVSLFGEAGGGQVGAQSADGGQGSILSPSTENTINTSNETNFFAFSTTFPQASGCFGGMQGGGAGSSVGGFLGFHYLNQDCWMSQLAEAEADAEVRALLKCGSKKFRNAIGFEQPGSKRQRFCVDYMEQRYVGEIAYARRAVDEAIFAGQLQIDAQMNAATTTVVDNAEAIAAIRDQLDRQAAAADRRDRDRRGLKQELQSLLPEPDDEEIR
jgi:hypothetical protein